MPLFPNPIVLIYGALAIAWAGCITVGLILLAFKRFRHTAFLTIFQSTGSFLGLCAPVLLYCRDISELDSFIIFIFIFFAGGIGGFFLGKSLSLKINRLLSNANRITR